MAITLAMKNVFTLLCIVTFGFTCFGNKTELWIGAFYTRNISAGGWQSAGVMPAVLMAVNDINNNTEILQNYTLRLSARDTKCNRGYAVWQLVDLIHESKKLMLIGGGCSLGTEATAETSHYWNLVQIAYSASSLNLSDKKRYPLLFRTCSSEWVSSPAKVAFLKLFQWTRVATVYQNEPLFSLTAHDLRRLLEKENVTIILYENLANDPDYQIENLKKHDARIIIGMFYSKMARKVFCSAFKADMYGAEYVWILPGWFEEKWWETEDDSIQCTPDQIRKAAGNYIAAMESTWSDDPRVTISGQTALELKKRYLAEIAKINYKSNDYSAFGYDAVWAAALTMNKSIDILKAKGKRLQDFNYTDNEMAQIFKQIMTSLSFLGMSGEVKFNTNGNRVGSVVIEQMQGDTEVVVGKFSSNSNEIHLNPANKICWEGGSSPVDHIKTVDKLVSIDFGLFVCFSMLSGFGIIMAAAFLAFNLMHNDKRFIKMSSPRLNNITVVGCIMIYMVVIIMGLDGQFLTDKGYSLVCQLQVWVSCIGFTLAYGAIFSKTWRVHVLFLKKLQRRVIRDKQLLVIVASFLLIDVVILVTWQIVDPLQRGISYRPIIEDKKRRIAERPYLEHCQCIHSVEWIGVILAYKGLLLVFGAFLAWETRKVTIPALNDSRNIGISVYTVLLSCTVGLPVLFVIRGMPDFAFALTGSMAVICTTITLCLMFIPKILMLKKPDEAECSTMTRSARPLSGQHPAELNNKPQQSLGESATDIKTLESGTKTLQNNQEKDNFHEDRQILRKSSNPLQTTASQEISANSLSLNRSTTQQTI